MKSFLQRAVEGQSKMAVYVFPNQKEVGILHGVIESFDDLGLTLNESGFVSALPFSAIVRVREDTSEITS